MTRRRAALISLAAAVAASACAPAEPPSTATAEAAIANCRGMKDLNGIPPGWHPVTVRWEPGSTFGDTVCIAPTQGPQIRFVAWLDAPMPAGYYVLNAQDHLDPTFAGCRRWTTWQGQSQCSQSWPRYTLQKNP